MNYTTEEHLIVDYRFKFFKFILDKIEDNSIEIPIILILRFEYILSIIIQDKNLYKIHSENDLLAIKEEIDRGLYDKYLLPSYYIENKIRLL